MPKQQYYVLSSSGICEYDYYIVTMWTIVKTILKRSVWYWHRVQLLIV